MTLYQELVRDQLTRKTLFNERKRMRKASAQQMLVNKQMVERRRAVEDRETARVLDCKVEDFAY